jgi:NAD(P)-dependent dehydrogenase (short-subunit alcohol dehydrogenase family)
MRPIIETTILVTGATDGLGRAVAHRLAAEHATVHVHGRDPARLAATVRSLREETGNDRIHPHLADLASLAEVRALATDVERSTDVLHVLVNNAGIGGSGPDGRQRRESRDGLELRLAVNHLAGFDLALRLMPLLRRSAPARIVNVASLGQAPLDFDDPQLERGYKGRRAYAQSKLAQITAGFVLAERLASSGVTVTSLHPGTYMPTKMVLQGGRRPVDTLETGIDATVRLAVAPELEGVTGRFFDRRREARAHEHAYDPEARRRLWELSLALTGAPDPA